MAGLVRHPKDSGGSIDREARDPIRRQPWQLICGQQYKTVAIKPGQPGPRADPEISVRRASQSYYRLVWQTIVHIPGAHGKSGIFRRLRMDFQTCENEWREYSQLPESAALSPRRVSPSVGHDFQA